MCASCNHGITHHAFKDGQNFSAAVIGGKPPTTQTHTTPQRNHQRNRFDAHHHIWTLHVHWHAGLYLGNSNASVRIDVLISASPGSVD